MPKPRHERTVVAFATISRPLRNSAEEQRRHRAGLSRSYMRAERNGLPVMPPYIYRGTGWDELAGTYGDTRLDTPYFGDGRWETA